MPCSKIISHFFPERKTFRPSHLLPYDHNNSSCSTLVFNHFLTQLLVSFCASPLLFFHERTALLVLGLPIVEVSRSQTDTPHSVGLLWTRYRPVAETCTWQYTPLSTDRHTCRRRDSNPQSQQRTTADAAVTGIGLPFLLPNIQLNTPSHTPDFSCAKQLSRIPLS